MSDQIIVTQFLVFAWWAAAFIACGVACAELAESKGNSGGSFFLGFLFGPIGLLIAWAMPANVGTVETRLVRQGKRRTCPSCAELVRTKASKCRHCGGELPPIVPAEQRSAPTAAPRLTQASLATWPGVPNLSRRKIAAIVAAVAVLIVIGATASAYNAGYRVVTPAEWWRSFSR